MMSALEFWDMVRKEAENIVNPEQYAHLGEQIQPEDEALGEISTELQQILVILLQKQEECQRMRDEVHQSISEELKELGIDVSDIVGDPRFCPAERIKEIRKLSPALADSVQEIFERNEYIEKMKQVAFLSKNLLAASRILRTLVATDHELFRVPFEIRSIKHIVLPFQQGGLRVTIDDLRLLKKLGQN